jgi:hypothetical protein
MKLLSTVALLVSVNFATASRLRGSSIVNIAKGKRRQLSNYYYSTKDASVLGAANPDAAIRNPLKGLLTSPLWTGGNTPDSVPSSLEFYYFGLDEIMRGNNDFDWTVLDKSIADAESRNNHVIWRVFCHYPGQPLRVPQFLIDAGVSLVTTASDGVSPQYDDPILLEAFQQFIAAFGAKYDGHKTVGFIQLGLLGKWGEWHTYPETNLLSDATKDKVVGWFDAAFQSTQLQVRNPWPSAYAAGMGLHDDSFGFSTLGSIDWFFWPEVEKAGQTLFWKAGAMGGETRPELQASIFTPDYAAGSDEYKQDFNECVQTTHATYMFHHSLFQGTVAGAELEKARSAHARMGYNFQVTGVGAAASSSGYISVDVTVAQTGVAPFYYPLSLALNCPGTTITVGGVEKLIEPGSSLVFAFKDVPADSSCLENVEITLQSDHVHDGRPVKFAQGTDGTVKLKLPLPLTATVVAPAAAPVAAPRTKAPLTAQPVKLATAAPTATPSTKAPVTVATTAPVTPPTNAPVTPPTNVPVTLRPTAADIVLSLAPIPSPTGTPHKAAPVAVPKAAPVAVPKAAPVAVPKAAPVVAPISTPVVAPKAIAPVISPAKVASDTVLPPVSSMAKVQQANAATAAAPVPAPFAAPASHQSSPSSSDKDADLFGTLFWHYVRLKSP